MCTVLLPPGDNPIAVNKYIISISITYFGCVFVALVIQDAKRMRLIILFLVVCLAVQYFSTYHEPRDFRDKKLLNIKCVFSINYV